MRYERFGNFGNFGIIFKLTKLLKLLKLLNLPLSYSPIISITPIIPIINPASQSFRCSYRPYNSLLQTGPCPQLPKPTNGRARYFRLGKAEE